MTQSHPLPPTYRLCLDVRTHRVIYFTNDPDYQAPDNSHVYTAEALIPQEMTLANCWQYRLVTGTLQHKTTANRAPRKGDSLQDGNRKALKKALNTKLQALWWETPAWRIPSGQCQKFADIEAAYLERITVCSQNQVQGLADEIAGLVI